MPPPNQIDQSKLQPQETTLRDEIIDELQQDLTYERNARREDQFVFIVVIVLLLDVVFFSIMPSFGGPLSILVVELLVLIPLAQRMGMSEIAKLLDRVVGRLTDGIRNNGNQQ